MSGQNAEKTDSAPCWSAPCDGCGVAVVVDRGDSPSVPDPGDWESFPECPVCRTALYFDEQPETLWDRESRLMRGASERAAKRLIEVAREQREAFLSSPGLDPAWIAGWHAATDHIAATMDALITPAPRGDG